MRRTGTAALWIRSTIDRIRWVNQPCRIWHWKVAGKRYVKEGKQCRSIHLRPDQRSWIRDLLQKSLKGTFTLLLVISVLGAMANAETL
jgi:hypothetical protein